MPCSRRLGYKTLHTVGAKRIYSLRLTPCFFLGGDLFWCHSCAEHETSHVSIVSLGGLLLLFVLFEENHLYLWFGSLIEHALTSVGAQFVYRRQPWQPHLIDPVGVLELTIGGGTLLSLDELIELGQSLSLTSN